MDWTEFIKSGIHDLFRSFKYKYKGVELTVDADTSNIPINDPDANKVGDLMVNFKLHVENESDTSYMEYNNFPMATIPNLTLRGGFSSDGSEHKLIYKLIPITGYTIRDGYLIYSNKFTDLFCTDGLYVFSKINTKTGSGTSKTLPLITFLRAATGKSFQEITSFFEGMIDVSTGIRDKNITAEECARMALHTLRKNSKNSERPINKDYEDFYNYLMYNTSGRAGKEKIRKFQDIQSFQRFVGMELSDMPSNSPHSNGTIVTRQIAKELDSLTGDNFISNFSVIMENGTRLKIKRCPCDMSENSIVKEQLNPEELMYAVYNYLLTKKGIKYEDDKNSLTCCILQSATDIVAGNLTKIWSNICNNLTRHLDESSDDINQFPEQKIFDGVMTRGNSEKPLNDIKSYILKSDQSRAPESTNSLSRFSQASKVTKINVTEYKQVHASQFGRICSYDTSESKTAGLNCALCVDAGLDEYQFITTPVYKVTNGVVNKSKVYHISALDELYNIIAPYEVNLAEHKENGNKVKCCSLNFQEVDANIDEIDYQRATPSTYSTTLSGCAYVHLDSPKRNVMASNAAVQASPPLLAEKPYISTGIERTGVGIYRAKDLMKMYLKSMGRYDGTIPEGFRFENTSCSPIENETLLRFKGKLVIPGEPSEHFIIDIPGNSKSISKTYCRVKQYVNAKGYYEGDDIVFHNGDIVVNDNTPNILGTVPDSVPTDNNLAIGNNVRVLFMCHEGFGFEDSIQVSKRFLQGFGLNTIYVFSKTSEITKDARQEVKYQFTNACNNSGKVIEYMSDNGLPKSGKHLFPNDPVIGKARITISNEMGEETIDGCPELLSMKEEGTVLYSRQYEVRTSNNEVKIKSEVVLYNILSIDNGDKLTGLHGNKSVCVKKIDIEDLFYTDSGEVPDIILNPQGCLARENIGQIIEALHAEICRKTGMQAYVEPSAKVNPKELINTAESYGIKPVTVYSPKTGEPCNEKCFLGTMYFTRSTHIMHSKYNACGQVSHPSKRTLQPPHISGGGGGQRISELTAWSYNSLGCSTVLDSLMSLQSDDRINKLALNQCIQNGDMYDGTYENYNALRLEAYARFLGVNIESYDGKTSIKPINSLLAEKLTAGALSENTTDLKGLYSEKIFQIVDVPSKNPHTNEVKSMSRNYGRMDLGFEFINPIFLTQTPFTNLILYIKRNGKTGSDGIGVMSDQTIKYIINGCATNTKNTSNSKKYMFGIIGSANKGEPVYFKIPGGEDMDVSGIFCVIDFNMANTIVSNTETNTTGEYTYLEYYEDRYKTKFYTDIVEFFKMFKYSPEDNSGCVYNLDTAEEIFRIMVENKRLTYAASEEESEEIAKENESEELSNTDGEVENIEKEVKSDLSAELNDSSNSDEESNAYDRYESYEDDSTVEHNLDINSKTISAEERYSAFIRFRKEHGSFNSFITKYVIIPPEIFRPYESSDNKPITRLTSAVTRIITVRTHSPFEKYDALMSFIGKSPRRKNDDYNIRIELFVHSTKNSIVRDTILAKRIAFSGRSVITVNPQLRIGEAAVPLRMIVVILRDLIVSSILTNASGALYDTVKGDINGSHHKENQKIVGNLITKVANNSDYIVDLRSDEFKLDAYPTYAEKRARMYEMLKDLESCVNKILAKYPGILSRDPALHMFSVAGFKLKVTHGYAIEIHPLTCKGYNADFDGDQMSINFPLHKKAVHQLWERGMFGINLINPQNGKSIIEYEQDMVIGCYYATNNTPDINKVKYIIDINRDDFYSVGLGFKHYAMLSLYDRLETKLCHVGDTVILCYDGRKYLTTVGKAMYNSLWRFEYTCTDVPDPENKGFYKLLYSSVMNKGTLNSSVTEYIIEHKAECDDDRFASSTVENSCYEGKNKELLDKLDRIKDFGFYMAEDSSMTLSAWDFCNVTDNKIPEIIDSYSAKSEMVDNYYKLKFIGDNEKSTMQKKLWKECNAKLTALFDASLNKSPSLDMMIRSGARGTLSNLTHICGMVGSVLSHDGVELDKPIRGSLMSGLSGIEALNNSYNGRRILLDTYEGSPVTGKQSRELVYMVEHLRISPTMFNSSCNASPTMIELEYNVDINDAVKKLGVASIEDVKIALSGSDSNWDKYVKEVDRLELATNMAGKYNSKIMVAYNIKKGFFNVNGNIKEIELKFDLDPIYENILRQRVVEINSVNSDARNIIENDATIENMSEGETMGPTWYVLNKKTIRNLSGKRLKRIGIYTMLGCECRDGICGRCFGHDYQTMRVPRPDYKLGYIAGQAIGECTSQLTFDTHKADASGGSSSGESSKNMWNHPTNVNLSTSNSTHEAFDKFKLMSDDINIENIKYSSYAETEGIVTVSKIPNSSNYLIEQGNTAFVTNLVTGINVVSGEVVPAGTPFSDHPYANDILSNARVRYKNGIDQSRPAKVSLDDDGKYIEYKNPLWLQGCLAQWLTVTREVNNKFGVLARNIETVVRSQTEVGISLEEKFNDDKSSDMDIYRSSRYLVNTLRDAEVEYKHVAVDFRNNLKYHHKILANMAMSYGINAIVDSSVNGYTDSGSSISDMLLSSVHMGSEGVVRKDIGKPISQGIDSYRDPVAKYSGQLFDQMVSEEEEYSFLNDDLEESTEHNDDDNRDSDIFDEFSLDGDLTDLF